MRHDPQIKGVLGAYLFPLLRANWAIDPGQRSPAGGGAYALIVRQAGPRQQMVADDPRRSWSRWRRRRQYQARACHYRQRGYAFT
jgi:hypothetical protein